MNHNILQKEAEFRQQNLELELKTQALIEEVNFVVKQQTDNNFRKPKFAISGSSADVLLNDIQKINVSRSSDVNIVETDGMLSESVCKATGFHSVTKFLKTKIEKLQDESRQIQMDYRKKCEETKRLQNGNKTFEEERTKLQQHLHSLTDLISKLESEIQILKRRISIKETENTSLRKEVDSLKRNLSSQSSTSTSNEVKLNRALEEIDRLKYSIRQIKMEAKETRDVSLKEVQELRSKNKRLENQKSDLLSAIKKQALLIDNLKKQKLHLESVKMLNISEEEFMKILDWNLPGKKETSSVEKKNSKNKDRDDQKNVVNEMTDGNENNNNNNIIEEIDTVMLI